MFIPIVLDLQQPTASIGRNSILTLSSLGFLEHSQPGEGADSAPPPPHRNIFIINAN